MGGATPCWIVLCSVASLADTLPSTCSALTERTLLWQFSQALPDLSIQAGFRGYDHSAISGVSPSWGHCTRSPSVFLLRVLLQMALGVVDVRKCENFPVEAARRALDCSEANLLVLKK